MSNERTLVLGSKGRMGRRYTAIARHLGHECDGWDTADNLGWPDLTEYTHIIIATPTNAHADWLRSSMASRVPHVLCEKPLCMDAPLAGRIVDEQAGTRTSINVVCNWSYVLPWHLRPGEHDILYANWMTGPHGADWDCCQLHYLDRDEAIIRDDSPVFHCVIDGCHHVTLSDIDKSYVAMLRDWYRDPRRLWSAYDAWEMERKVESIIERRKAGT